jgi:hypothetical protein
VDAPGAFGVDAAGQPDTVRIEALADGEPG